MLRTDLVRDDPGFVAPQHADRVDGDARRDHEDSHAALEGRLVEREQDEERHDDHEEDGKPDVHLQETRRLE